MNTLLEDYKIYVKDTEAPASFHAWTVIGIMSSLLGRKCFIPQGYFTVFPNLYVVLVGEAGSRKSSSLNVAKDILRNLEDFPLAPESASREALLDSMEENRITYTSVGKQFEYHQATALAGELSEFLGGKHISDSMTRFITSIWDEPKFEYKTRNKGTVKLESPYFNMVACCTFDWLIGNLKMEMISDGFARRIIFVRGGYPEVYNDWPELKPEQASAMQRIVLECKRIHKLVGEFVFTHEARALWRDLYVAIQKSLPDKPDRVRNYYSTKHTLMLKVCMCLTAAYRNDKVVDSNMLKLVNKLFIETEKSLDEIYSGAGRNELKPLQEKLLMFIQSNSKGVSKREITKKFRGEINKREMEELLEVLVEGGYIQRSELQETAVSIVTHYKALSSGDAEEKTTSNLLELICSYKPASNETPMKTPELLSGEAEQKDKQKSQHKADLAAGLLLKASKKTKIK